MAPCFVVRNCASVARPEFLVLGQSFRRDAPTCSAQCNMKRLESVPHLPRRAVLACLASFTLPSKAYGADQTEYDTYAQNYDALDAPNLLTNLFGFDNLRRQLVPHGFGEVIEFGIGTGINLPLYNQARVTSITGLDTSQRMLAKARLRAEDMQSDIPIRLLNANAERVPFRDQVFDTVVDTFCLCVYQNPALVLQEMKRLVKPQGVVLLVEHTRSEQKLLGAYQDITASATASLSKGCYPNQNVRALVLAAGFKIIKERVGAGGTVVAMVLAT